jgi:hypothetical protein
MDKARRIGVSGPIMLQVCGCTFETLQMLSIKMALNHIGCMRFANRLDIFLKYVAHHKRPYLFKVTIIGLSSLSIACKHLKYVSPNPWRIPRVPCYLYTPTPAGVGHQ